jgi:hypothetical protein
LLRLRRVQTSQHRRPSVQLVVWASTIRCWAAASSALLWEMDSPKVFGAFYALVQRCDLLDAAGHAIIGGDLKQNLHVHGVPPVAQNHAAEAARARRMV